MSPGTRLLASDSNTTYRPSSVIAPPIAPPVLSELPCLPFALTLTGTVAEDDANALGPVVSGVRGVRNLVDQTQVEEEAIG